MKATLVFLSFLLFSISTPSFFSSAAEEPEAVLDVNGKELRVDVEYFIIPLQAFFLGGIRVSSFNNETCPLSVIQSPIEVDDGLPLTFKPVDPTESTVRVSTDLNIKFSKFFSICIQSNVWNLGYDEPTGKYVIYINGEEGNPGPETYFNWFKIIKHEPYYRIVFCPYVCDSCGGICRDVGIFIQEGKRRLALTDDNPAIVMFKEASTSSVM